MQSVDQTNPNPKALRWIGWILSVLPALMLLLGGVMNLTKAPAAVEGAVKLGFPESVVFGLGVVVVICVILYLIPQTAVLGAILLTGWLGGAVASHVRAGDPWAHIIVPPVFGAILWLGLYLRDPRLRALIPIRT
jgi:hypothetical protein